MDANIIKITTNSYRDPALALYTIHAANLFQIIERHPPPPPPPESVRFMPITNKCMCHPDQFLPQSMMTSSNRNFFRVTGHLCGEFTGLRGPVTRSFDAFFDLRLNKRLSKQWWGWWFETLSHPFLRHCNGILTQLLPSMIVWRD